MFSRIGVTLFCLLFFLSSCYLRKAYQFRKMERNDIYKMASTSFAPSESAFQFIASNPGSNAALKSELDKELANTDTWAFLVIRNDSILYENYYDGAGPDTKIASFSAAKSITSSLLAMAHEEGKIGSFEDPLTRYIPELKKKDARFERISLQQVLDMRSGIKTDENFANPKSEVVKIAFTSNLYYRLFQIGIDTLPGIFQYKSANTQYLALAVERATGQKFQDYFFQKIWLPLGMQYEASWNMDSERRRNVKAFCCFNAAALDYAKFGRLLLNKGNWQGKQLLSENWITTTTAADTMKKYGGYRNQIWAATALRHYNDSLEALKAFKTDPLAAKFRGYTNPETGQRNYYVSSYDGSFHAEGMFDQFVYVNPKNKVLIVRLGKAWKHPVWRSREFIYQLGQRL
jgi:CubicO group peptidase (beta-lactamase class C family)